MATTTYGTPYVEAADLVSGYPSTSLSLADRVDDISFKGNGINNQTGTAYTLDILDAGKTVTLSNSSAVTVTIPTNTAEAIEIGSIIRFNNKGAGTVTVQPDGGVTLNGGNISLAQNAAAQIVKLDTNTWGAIDSLGSPPGLVLINPTSIANSGGSASASGGAVTFSGVTSVSVNGVFTSTHDNYRMVLECTAGTTTLTMRLRASGSDSSTGYGRQKIEGAASSASANSLTSQTEFQMSNVNSAGTDVTCDIFAPNIARLTGFISIYSDRSAGFAGIFGGYHNVTTAYDGFTLFVGTGSITGTVRTYGYTN